MNELTEKWEKTGLLAELDDFNKDECAASLEETGNLLMGEMNDYMEEVDKAIGEEGYLAGTIIPVVRRLYGSDEESCPEKMPTLSLKWLMEDFGEYTKKMYHTYKELEARHNVDGEAELILMYIMHLKNRL